MHFTGSWQRNSMTGVRHKEWNLMMEIRFSFDTFHSDKLFSLVLNIQVMTRFSSWKFKYWLSLARGSKVERIFPYYYKCHILGISLCSRFSSMILFFFPFAENHRLQSAYDNHLIVKLILVSKNLLSEYSLWPCYKWNSSSAITVRSHKLSCYDFSYWFVFITLLQVN